LTSGTEINSLYGHYEVVLFQELDKPLLNLAGLHAGQTGTITVLLARGGEIVSHLRQHFSLGSACRAITE